MSETLDHIRELALRGEILVSAHGYDELAADGISIDQVLAGLAEAEVVEDYPDYSKGPCVLVLQRDSRGHPIHVLWGIPRGRNVPAVVITAYRPDPSKWTPDLRRRKT